MKKNLNNTDRMVRLILAMVSGILLVSNAVMGTHGLLMVLLAIVFVTTAIIRYCPLYAILGLSTCKSTKPKRNPWS